MNRGALQTDDYYKGQAVEVRGTRNGREFWTPATIHQRMRRGCEITYREGNQSPQHIMFHDLRPAQPTERQHTPKISTPLLTAADIDRINREADEKAKREAEVKAQALATLEAAREAPTQTLVLLRNKPEVEAVESKRKARPHSPTPLSNFLRDARLRKGIQQQALAKTCGSNSARLSRLESGDDAPSDDEALALSIALDLDLGRLLALRDSPEAANAPADITPQLLELQKQVAELQQANARLLEQAKRAASSMPAGSHESAQLREENAVLRNAVLFYVGLR